MKRALIWIGAITLITGISLYIKYQIELSYKLLFFYNNFKVSYASVDKITIDFDFMLKNSGDLQIDVTKVDIDVYANDVLATRIYSDKMLSILPLSESKIPMQLVLNPKDLLKNINQLAYGSSSLDTMRIKFKGKVKVKKLGMNIPIPFVYTLSYKELMG